ncbi:hypothetical protein L3V82_02110 [Thiotrichales bacterium 19S3-7]|nr:hypothetical protein [Thiotrichales bacterium 19S3-7]MCF6800960.1 hypothetical protein [Thiotrichales bacterium 19S3-11]
MSQKNNINFIPVSTWLFVGGIILGLFDMFSSNSIVDAAANFYLSDIIAYLIFATLIFLLIMGHHWAKYVYVLMLIFWFSILFLLLIPYYNHTVNLVIITLQITLNLLGILILSHSQKSVYHLSH